MSFLKYEREICSCVGGFRMGAVCATVLGAVLMRRQTLVTHRLAFTGHKCC